MSVPLISSKGITCILVDSFTGSWILSSGSWSGSRSGSSLSELSSGSSFSEDGVKDTGWPTEGDLVYIPFAGSGSEIVSCINNNRNYIATEINNDYITYDIFNGLTFNETIIQTIDYINTRFNKNYYYNSQI